MSAAQHSQALLQRIQRDDPELWKTIAELPDGIRSALEVHTPQDDIADGMNDNFIQAPMLVEGAQMPMGAISEAEPSPFDAPGSGDTLALLATGEVKACYAVGADLRPRQITPAQFVAAAECQTDTPRRNPSN